MNISITASVLILLACLVLGWRNYREISAAREESNRLRSTATRLGIDPSTSGEPVSRTRRGREVKKAAADDLAKDIITFVDGSQTGSRFDPNSIDRATRLRDRLASMDIEQLRNVVAEILGDEQLESRTRGNSVTFLVRSLSEDRPEAAVALMTNAADLFSGVDHAELSLMGALGKLANVNPAAALQWVKTTRETFPQLVTEREQNAVIFGIASTDPKLAFRSLGELGIEDPARYVSSIIASAKTPEARTAAIHALREYIANETGPETRPQIVSAAFSSLGHHVSKTGFDAGDQWIKSSEFTPDELENFASGLSYFETKEDSGKWIHWIGENLPPEKASDSIRSIVRNWTENDFKAAGEWLVATPAGPAKNTAIQSYSETVSHYDPETAAEWAATLPEGKDRTDTLKQIYRNWPKNDPVSAAGAAKFATDHGLK